VKRVILRVNPWAGQHPPCGHKLLMFIVPFKAILPLWTKDDALTIEIIDDAPGVLDFNVRRCRYAETYRAMGLGAIGDILSCDP
jgi:L-2-amino-thiazoline-4-carboxylic acid hydrolase